MITTLRSLGTMIRLKHTRKTCDQTSTDHLQTIQRICRRTQVTLLSAFELIIEYKSLKYSSEGMTKVRNKREKKILK